MPTTIDQQLLHAMHQDLSCSHGSTSVRWLRSLCRSLLLSTALSRLVDLSTPLESNKHENPYRVSSRPVISLTTSLNGVALAVSPAVNSFLHRHHPSRWPPRHMICWGANCVSMVWSPRISLHVIIIGRLSSPPSASSYSFPLCSPSLLPRLPIFHVSIVIHIFAVSTLFRRPFGSALALPCVFLDFH